MPNGHAVTISGAVEGPTDEAVLRRLIIEVGATPGPIHGKKGKEHLEHRLRSYNYASQYAPWIVLMDLDREECLVALKQKLLPDPQQLMCFRIAVRTIEAWLLADKRNLSDYLSVPISRIPSDPESILNPKQALVTIASYSRRRDVLDMVPRPKSGRSVGPAYTGKLIEFIQNMWNPSIAAESSDSLKRSLRCLQRFVE